MSGVDLGSAVEAIIEGVSKIHRQRFNEMESKLVHTARDLETADKKATELSAENSGLKKRIKILEDENRRLNSLLVNRPSILAGKTAADSILKTNLPDDVLMKTFKL